MEVLVYSVRVYDECGEGSFCAIEELIEGRAANVPISSALSMRIYGSLRPADVADLVEEVLDGRRFIRGFGAGHLR